MTLLKFKEYIFFHCLTLKMEALCSFKLQQLFTILQSVISTRAESSSAPL